MSDEELSMICDMCGSEMDDDAYGFDVPLCSDGCAMRFQDAEEAGRD